MKIEKQKPFQKILPRKNEYKNKETNERKSQQERKEPWKQSTTVAMLLDLHDCGVSS